jgi:hypothetical protein
VFWNVDVCHILSFGWIHSVRNVHVCHIPSFGWIHIIWSLCVDVCSMFVWHRHIVLKCWHIKFRRWGLTQKKEYNIQNTAKFWKQLVPGAFFWYNSI